MSNTDLFAKVIKNRTNWIDVLEQWAAEKSNDTAFLFLNDGEIEDARLSYGDLARRARAIGATLQSMGMAGERALILFQPGYDYISAFFGCLYADVIAVPAYPPRNNRSLPRLLAIMEDSKAAVAMTTSSIYNKFEGMITRSPELSTIRWLTTDTVATVLAEQWQRPNVHFQSLAFLQYTSGSTGSPKGVMLTHGNLLHNSFLIQQGFDMGPDSKGIIWLPPYHDMGLIGGILQPLFIGTECVLMSPAAFLQRPLRWLKAISDYKGTVSGGPNFAYDYCANKITPEERETLDLSTWRVAFNGAEPVRSHTLDNFVRTFASCGFRKEAFYPCYGLAEATLFVSGGQVSRVPKVAHFDKAGLEKNLIQPVSADTDDAYELVGCGHAWHDETIAIVDPATCTRCQPGQVGEIWISGDSIAQGYWQRSEESEKTFCAYLADTGEGPFMRTEDLGFFWDGELYVTGRIKDMIIIRGANHYPQDIELTVERSHPSFRLGCSAAFSVDIKGEERLVVAQEVEFRQSPDINEASAAARLAVAEGHEIQLYALVLIKPGHIPKTSSGKIQRHACRRGFLEGTLETMAEWRMSEEALIEEPAVTETQVIPVIVESARPQPSQQELQNWLVSQISRRLGVAVREIDVRQPFARYGMDSVNAIGLAGDLEKWLGYSLAPTLIYDYPSIDALARHLASEKTSVHIKSELAQPTEKLHEPIAVIGMSCRFPKARNLAEFWQLLRNGMDAIEEIPSSRWDVNKYFDTNPDTPAKMITRYGGFLADIDLFDPTFFGISPREAARMDPQQRIFMEVAWEALESSGIAADKLAGSRTGVYVGVSNVEYSQPQYKQLNLIDAYTGTGNSHCVIANRVSYSLDLRGPSMAVDTACSSALVAVDLAVKSLRSGESYQALAGGVNLMLDPGVNISFSHARMMAADGRCKTFDAAADGYIRSEGCGVVVLKRLSDAIKDGDPILAVIKGSAVNQDGRSNGLTAPNGVAQQDVIYQAMQDARVTPEQVQYLEAHGTGTALGDPIEVQALGKVFKNRSKSNPCLIGSVKTNIGHTEAAAGIASLIKVVLALQNGEIPAHLHFKQINPLIPIDQMPLEIVTSGRSWPKSAQPRIAGVSAFGFGGANAHLIVEEAPVREPVRNDVERPLHILTLSAKSDAALKELAMRYGDFIAVNSDLAIADLCLSANTGRIHLEHRLAILAQDAVDMTGKLNGYVADQKPSGLLQGSQTQIARPKVAFLFTGQGAQYVGMGRTLYQTQPTFKRTLDRCAAILSAHLEKPLLSVLFDEPDQDSLLHETQYTQPALFALEYSLAELWRSWGIEPDFLIGHSVGEYVAACVAGIFSLEDGLKLIAARGRLMQSLPQDGDMAAVFADLNTVSAAIQAFEKEVSVAGVNGPDNVVISGKRTAIQTLIEQFNAQKIRTRTLNVSHAFHSPLMEPILEQFERIARAVEFRAPHIPIVSNVTGELMEPGQVPDAAYWRNHIRRPVLFLRGMETLKAAGCTLFIEPGPNPTLLGMAKLCLPDLTANWLPSLKKGQDDWQMLLTSVATAYTLGLNINWTQFDEDYRRNLLSLPTYPFQRRRFWYPEEKDRMTRSFPDDQGDAAGRLHPLLARRVNSPALKDTVFESWYSPSGCMLLNEHRIYDTPVYPATGYLELALAAAHQLSGDTSFSLEKVAILEAMRFSDSETRNAQVILNAEQDGQIRFQIFSTLHGGDNGQLVWQQHATGLIKTNDGSGLSQHHDLAIADIQASCTELPEISAYYQGLHDRGLGYGPGFQTIDRLWYRDNEVLSWLRLPAESAAEASQYLLHPALLDGAFQSLGALLTANGQAANTTDIFLPIGAVQYRLYQRSCAGLWSHARLVPTDGSGHGLVVADFNLYDQDGRLVAQVHGAQFKQANLAALFGMSKERLREWLYEIQWQIQDEVPKGNVVADTTSSWLIFDADNAVNGVLKELQNQKISYLRVTPGETFTRLADGHWQLNPEVAADYQQLLQEIKASGHSLAQVLHFWSFYCDREEMDDNSLASAQTYGWGSVLFLVQALVQAGLAKSPRLWLVTRGAQPVPDSVSARTAIHAPLLGLARVIALEQPELQCARIDFDPGNGADNSLQMLAEIMAASVEDQVAYRTGRRYVARLARKTHRADDVGRPKRLQLPANDQPFRLEIPVRGVLDNLVLAPHDRRAPAPGQVEIRIHATGLNFRDVLNAMGLYPGDPGPLGGECAGEIVSVGENTDLKIGDRVMAIASGSFGSYVTTYADLVVKIPEKMSYEEATTIPIVFLTAHYALNRLAKMKAGDRVFIHAASGGVGLAAIQLARNAGAELFVTAGDEEKHEFLRRLGIKNVMYSRTLDFSDQVMELTGGKGVDIVLNFLSGDYIPKTLSMLAPDGKFLEIGKIGIWSSEQVAAVKPNAAYFTIALDDLSRDHPALIQSMFKELMAEFAAGRLQPLIHRVYQLQDVVEAFRFMQQSRHIGKIVLSQRELIRDENLRKQPLVRSDATYLITGGYGALGTLVARWLVEQGAKYLLLAGLGEPGDPAKQLMAELKNGGVTIEIAQVNVADRAQAKAMLEAMSNGQKLPPLAGVIHMAGLLDDGVILQQTPERFQRVLAPKVYGSYHLHELTKDMPLDFFICFSSIASMLGSPGQSNYAAANAFMDGLAHYRRSRGLPALSVNWGPWADAGMAAALAKQDQRRQELAGMAAIKPEPGLQILAELLRDASAQVGVLPINWPVFIRQFVAGREPALLIDLIQQAREKTGQKGVVQAELINKLKEVAPAERNQVVVEYLATQAARVLGLDASQRIDARKPLNEMGLDSLMAIELKNALSAAVGKDLPATLLFNYPTIAELSEFLIKDFFGESEQENIKTQGITETKESDSILAKVENLSEDEMEALLDEKLAAFEDIE